MAFDDTATRSDCPSAKLVGELAGGRLPDAEVTGIETHAAGCTTCMARITLARGSRAEMDVTAVALREEQAPVRRGTVVGRYVIEHAIGEGGMGVVFSALDKELDRRVAIKLLSQRPGSSSEWRVRLQREARAMARLSHPNIVPIFDIGVTASDQVFIAMELIEGVTLRTWRKTPRAWPDVLAMFRQIGRGLAAVHDAGLVHRDVKPANILIGVDGRARLTDFGVVKLGDERPSSEIELERPRNVELTRAGSVIGTIPYMAPEQLRGQVADPRTDQFSFCVMLYEALYGENPCASRDPLHLDEWRLPEVACDGDAPAWVRRVVVRGLAADAALRYPTMHALLADLEPVMVPRPATTAAIEAPRPLRRALWLAVPALGAAAVATALFVNMGVADSCPDPRVELEGVWDAPRKEAIRAAFAATKRPYAATSFASVERILDRYTERWAAMRSETCVADNPLVRECLQWRLDELRAQTDAFAAADGKVVERAVGAASSLGDLAACSNVAALDARAVKSGPLTDRAQRAEIDQLRARLARAKVLADLGKYADGIALAAPVVERAVALAYRPLEAEAYHELGDLQRQGGQFEASAESLDKAIVAAVAGRHDDIAARAGIKLGIVVGIEKAKYDDGHTLLRHAKAAIERLGGDPRLEMALANATSVLLRKQGMREASLAHSERALQLGEPLLGANHPDIASTLNSQGLTYLELGKLDEARSRFERARALWTAEAGDRHPAVGFANGNLGLERFRGKHYDEAIAYGTRAIAILEESLGADSPRLIASLTMTADAYAFSGRAELAVPMLERALVLNRKTRKGPHPSLANGLTSLGHALVEVGQARRAVPLLEEALEIRIKIVTDDTQDVGETRFMLARAVRAVGQRERAAEIARVAREELVRCAERCVRDLAELDAWSRASAPTIPVPVLGRVRL